MIYNSYTDCTNACKNKTFIIFNGLEIKKKVFKTNYRNNFTALKFQIPINFNTDRGQLKCRYALTKVI